ncbi:MAG: barnase inhibitor [Phycisphaerae bacterium]
MTDEPSKKVSLVLDGRNLCDFSGFCAEFNGAVTATMNATWHGNLDAFNDFLYGPYNDCTGSMTPGIPIWRNSHLSRVNLGHQAMVQWLERTLETCHQSNRVHAATRLEAARSGLGPTLFDMLVEIIPNNSEYVELRLE